MSNINAKSLIVYYSRSGTTKKVAEYIAAKVHGTLAEITEAKSRKGILGFLRSGLEAVKKKTPPIILGSEAMDRYDMVFIGTPLWAGAMASPIRTYLTQFPPKGSKIKLFVTKGGANPSVIANEVAQMVGIADIQVLELRMNDVKKDTFTANVDAWLSN
jgi:flavodoxin